MARHLNGRGIEPYLTMSCDVPRWMLGPDGRTLAEYHDFAELAASFAAWARDREGIRYRLFGPLNETDLGSPEGPTVAPEGFVRALEALDAAFARRRLDEVKFVVAEQGKIGTDHLKVIRGAPGLARRIGAFGFHLYWTLPEEMLREVLTAMDNGPFSGIPYWMTEYGDLDESGEREWMVAWSSTERLLSLLRAGCGAALAWDAFDNYHDHDRAWTVYGLFRHTRGVYTPKNRYYAAKQVYRFVCPGMARVTAQVTFGEGRDYPEFAAFRGNGEVSVVGMNRLERPVTINITVEDPGPAGRRWYCHVTTRDRNCAREILNPVSPTHWPYHGVVAMVPPRSIFTVSTLSD